MNVQIRVITQNEQLTEKMKNCIENRCSTLICNVIVIVKTTVQCFPLVLYVDVIDLHVIFM